MITMKLLNIHQRRIRLKKLLILPLFLLLSGCDDLPLGATPFTLRVVERDGICIVQRYDRLFLIGEWEDTRKFKTREDAEKYKEEWLENYRKYKEDENKIH